tara:strand:- start:329 stop:1039 length:711 start_codon:yes stop_codon:yes gene_type:complete
MAGIKTGISGQINNNIITEGLVFYVDPAYKRSYPGSGTTYSNLKDLSNEGTLYHGISLQPNHGGVWDFDGPSDYSDTNFQAPTSTQATVGLWVNINSQTNYGGLVVDSTGAGAQTRLTLSQGGTSSHPGKLSIYVGDGSSSDADFNVSIPSFNTFFCLCATINGTAVNVYIDGQLSRSYTSGVSYVGNGQHDYYLGGWGNTLHLNGQMGPVQIYDKELSAAEVLQNYQAQKERFGL